MKRWILSLATTAMAVAGPADYAPRDEFHARLEPQAKIVHGAGQDPEAFRAYEGLFPVGRKPSVMMTYIGLTRPIPEIVSWGEALARDLGPAGPGELRAQIGLNLTFDKDNGSSAVERISTGAYDDHIDAFVRAVDRLDRPVYVRIGYEFEGSWNGYSPEAFVKVWRRILPRLRSCRHEVAVVWCAAGGSAGWVPSERLMQFYPGDDCVDWWGIDLFSPDEITHPALGRFLDLAGAHRKPVMIGEMTPRYVGAEAPASWDRWFGPLLSLLKSRPEIKAIDYIDWDWKAQSKRLGFSWDDWGDARVERSPLVRERWVEALSEPLFLGR